MNLKKSIYFDYAATTYTDRRVLQAMKPYFGHIFGNAGSLHQFGRKAKLALGKARQQVADLIGAETDEIIFTSSGTESDNLAILGVARAYEQKGQHLITSNIEHKAVLNPMKKLSQEGFEIDFLQVDHEGLLTVDQIRQTINDKTTLISIIYASNEIGVIQPIAEIGKMIEEIRAKRKENAIDVPLIFHIDACQAAGYLSLDVDSLGVDLLTLNGSKIYGPKGVGVLYVRKGIVLEPIMSGGDQEGGMHPGTENVPGAVGLGVALDIAQKIRQEESNREKSLRDYFIERLIDEIPNVSLNGHAIKRLPNNINISVLGIEGEAMLLWLDKYGIAASTGSACDSRHLEPSHVILALGKSHEYAHGSLRLTLGRKTTKKEIGYFMNIFPKIVRQLRKISTIKHE